MRLLLIAFITVDTRLICAVISLLSLPLDKKPRRMGNMFVFHPSFCHQYLTIFFEEMSERMNRCLYIFEAIVYFLNT
jgi:hypothetical protein